MVYRALTVGIVAFWLLMMGLLLRVEFSSGEGELIPVPAEYVWSLMFLHDQPSELVLYHQRQRIGNFHLQPRHLPTGTDGTGGPVRLLTGSGVTMLNLPGLSEQNLTLRGSLEMNECLTTQRFEVNANLHTPGQNTPGLTMILDAQPARDHWHYQVRRGDAVLQENTGPAAVLLEALDTRAFGIDPKSILLNGQLQVATTAVNARRGILHLNTEDIECYVVTIHGAEMFETTVYISQLGQILAVKSFGGYSFYEDTLTP